VKQRVRCAPPRVAATDTRRVRPPDKVAAPIYQTDEYRAWRLAVIGRSDGHCQEPACTDPLHSTRLFADHVVELRDGGAPFDVSNGQALCGSCHTLKTIRERARRLRLR
jgi:5-methylcytosine-specific restriction enzyme A